MVFVETFKNLFTVLFQLLKLPLCVFGAVFAVYFVMVIFYMYYYKKQGLKRGYIAPHIRLKKKSVLKRLFIDAPKQYVIDYYNRDIGFFRKQGLIIFTGRQGSGKTVSMVKELIDCQEEYPACKVITNFGYLEQNDELNDWRQLIDYKNGKKGVVAALDELQNWFSSNQSKDFPPEMLGVITQNRKNRRMILGTAQSFHLLAKSIRSQTVEVRKCFTLGGCLTFVHRVIPILDAEGNVKQWKHKGWYFFVHDEKIRKIYDTYRVIESLGKSGFHSDNRATDVNISVFQSSNKKKRC